MKEFLENPKFVTKQDGPRPHNKQLLIDIFDSSSNWKNLKTWENMKKFYILRDWFW